MRKKATRVRPYFTMESVMTAILRGASGKMHHGILFARRLAIFKRIPAILEYGVHILLLCLWLLFWKQKIIYCYLLVEISTAQLSQNINSY